MPRLTIFLIKSGDAPFAGHSVQATFRQQDQSTDDTSAAPIVSARRVAEIDGTDKAALTLPSLDIVVGDILIEVVAPDGEVLISELLARDDLGSELRLEVEPKSFASPVPSDDPSFGAPSTLRGRLIDRAGRREIAGVQVILIGTREGEDQAFPLLTGRTDAKGYFSGPYPRGFFSGVEAVIGIEGVENVPVRRLDDGSLPGNVILVIDLAEDASLPDIEPEVPRQPDEGDLTAASETFRQDAGGCIDFHKPNRTLESVEFFSVVRTTEPEIKGLTLQEPPRINIRDLISVVRPKTTPVLAARLQPSGPQSGTGPTLGTGAGTFQPNAGASVSRPGAATFAEIPELLDIAALDTRLEQQDPEDTVAAEIATATIDADIAATLAQDPDGFSLTRLASAELASNARRLDSTLDRLRVLAAGRADLDCETPVDWDLTPTIYQSCTVAHGHVLTYRQDWVADGYSLGDLVYSLPLAPCQKKNIAVVDWERRETAARQESLEEEEQLTAFLSRDRDITEVVRGVVAEEMEATSSSSTSSGSAGFGFGFIGSGFGGLLGASGGSSSADAQANQRSSRSTAASTMQKLRDRTRQAASAVRSQRATVVQTVRQGETVRVETEVVANHNHCHAITIQWFEVLRHLLVRTNLTTVRECLFVPLLMSRFDSHKALRHREALTRFLRTRSLAPAFEAVERIVNNYSGSDLPTGAFADEALEAMDGFLRLRIRIARPRDDADGAFDATGWQGIERLLGINAQEFHGSFLEGQQQRDRIFAEQLGDDIARAIVDALRLSFTLESGGSFEVPLDPTLVSRFRNGASLYVSLRLAERLAPLNRRDISAVEIRVDPLRTSGADIDVDEVLPPGSLLVVDGGQVRYRTAHLSHDLFRNARIRNDLGRGDTALVFTPLSRRELENPREKDKEAARRVLKHLNEHLEYYHRIIWTLMDANRRYLLLDGFVAPNSGGRSIASVVENRLIGIVGNCLVMPVAPGFNLDPTLPQDGENPVDLIEHYTPEIPEPPLPVALPTKGVFAEAVMGKCNSCEIIDETRFWRWDEAPCPDDPTPITPPSTEGRRAEPPDLTPTEFPNALVQIQTPPNAPDPSGLAAALNLLANPNLFRDITGLERTQQNALEALRSAFQSAQAFGQGAAGLATTGAQLQFRERLAGMVRKARADKLINDDQAADLLGKIILGGQQQTKPDKSKEADEKAKATEKKLDAVQKAKEKGQVSDSAAMETSEAIVKDLSRDENVPDTTDKLEDLAKAAAENKVNLKGEAPTGERLEALALTPAAFPSGTASPPVAGNIGVLNQIEQAFRARSLELRTAIGAAADAERRFWENGGNRLRESDAAALPRLEDYATSIGAANPAAVAADYAADAEAWSAAFVSHVMREGGVRADEFVFASGHDEYVKMARDNREAQNFLARFWLCTIDEVAPDIGDILIMNRGGGTVAFNPAIAGGGLPGDFNSHGDIMTSISVTAAGDPALATLGGNLSQSVRRRIVPTDDQFRVTANSHRRVEPANLRPDNYFAIMRLRDSIFEVYP